MDNSWHIKCTSPRPAASSSLPSPSRNQVCSMCYRPGGSCIKCRIVNCSYPFSSLVCSPEGLLHATNSSLHTGNQSLDVNAAVENPAEKEPTCPRTEGYKGHKMGEALRRNLDSEPNDKSGYLVTQEQINAWLHINGQKLYSEGSHLKPIASDTEYDCRGWVSICTEGVVEYVDEIVGTHVADKRELEYQSGKNLQCKSACYFFRINKEHIIDATHRGGIARFVNHSCLPDCVAKIISVRNEKKVVFFVERDINPGEEITYDYHFNHEDEREKIPCLCKSKNYRRYLN